jgi:hypothetical protein
MLEGKASPRAGRGHSECNLAHHTIGERTIQENKATELPLSRGGVGARQGPMEPLRAPGLALRGAPKGLKGGVSLQILKGLSGMARRPKGRPVRNIQSYGFGLPPLPARGTCLAALGQEGPASTGLESSWARPRRGDRLMEKQARRGDSRWQKSALEPH